MLTGRCLTEPSALDGRCTQMVALQIAEPLCPRDRLVGGVLHPFRHGNAAETADPLEQIQQKHASFMAIRQVSHKRTVDLDGVDRQSLEVLPRGVAFSQAVFLLCFWCGAKNESLLLLGSFLFTPCRARRRGV